MKVLSVVLLLTLAVIFSGCQGLQKQPVAESSEATDADERTIEKAPEAEVKTEEDVTSGDVEKGVSSEVSVPADNPEDAVYENYSEARYDELLGKKPFAVFFHAPWCGTCLGMEKEILANISDLPAGVIILKADYDTEKALEAKYGVTSQSLIVVIDADGQAKETLVAPDVDEIAESFAKLL